MNINYDCIGGNGDDVLLIDSTGNQSLQGLAWGSEAGGPEELTVSNCAG
jgi:hypothetical protein